MDKLKDQSGYTIMETLVSILLIGIIITLFAMFFNQVFSNPKLLLRSEALNLANQEVERSINTKSTTDTSYTNNQANLRIERKIESEESLVKAIVSVKSVIAGKEILSLSVMYKL